MNFRSVCDIKRPPFRRARYLRTRESTESDPCRSAPRHLIALIQGVTEFLPISSSGHLILLPGLTGRADQGQVIDVAVHVGTLAP